MLATDTAYELELTKDLDPTLIGKAPTNTPEQFSSMWLDGYSRGEGVGPKLRGDR